jgi:cobalt-zinc-cadmium efflux system outer membrane protein
MTYEQAGIMGEEALLKREIANIASERLKAGDISGLEETAFRLESARAQEAALRFAQNAQQAEYYLKTLMGMEPDGMDLELTDTHGTFTLKEDVSAILEGAFAARPDMRAAEIAVEAAGHRVGWEQSKILNFTAILDANGEGKEGFEMGPGVQIELPILNNNSGKIARAKADLDQAAKQYLAVKQRIAGDVLESFSNCVTAQKALRILGEDIFPTAQYAAEKAGEAFDVGEISYLELLDFKQKLLDARLQMARAKAAVWQAGINLKFSTGFTMDVGMGGGTYED